VAFRLQHGQYSFIVSGSDTGTNLCGFAQDDEALNLQCPDNTKISYVSFASYGVPIVQPSAESVTCPFKMQHGDVHAGSSVAVIEELCIGKSSCQFKVESSLFMNTPKVDVSSLAVSVYCS